MDFNIMILASITSLYYHGYLAISLMRNGAAAVMATAP